MSEPIFVDPPGTHDRPVDYVANPLRVDRLATPGNPARIDLIALANNIVARETECRQLRAMLTAMAEDQRDMRVRLDRLEAERVSGKLGRIVKAATEILTEPDHRDDDDEYV